MYNLSAVGFEFHLLNWTDSTCTVGGMSLREAESFEGGVGGLGEVSLVPCHLDEALKIL